MKKDLLLPNGLPIYKMMQYKPTGEKCQFVKINNDKISEVTIDTITVDVKIIRTLQGINYTVIETVNLNDLIIWNESMNPHREVTYRTRKHQARTVVYNPNN